MLRVYAVGGYNEVGRNMTCIETNEDAVILDMGLYMDRFISLQEKNCPMNKHILQEEDAIPNESPILALRKKIRGIVVTHAHLDHIGAINWMAARYKCPIIGTPYSIEIMRQHASNEEQFVALNVNSFYRFSKTLSVELINVTHSVPQSALVVLNTPSGNIVYALDYKNDNHPTLGKKTNTHRLKKLDNVLLLIADSTNADEEGKTFSEYVAFEMLKDIIMGMETDGHGMFLTTFSSHVARLQSMLTMSKMLGRKPIFIGRSIEGYISAAEKLRLVSFSDKAEIIKSVDRNVKKLRTMQEERDKYVFIVTGGMGETKAVLTRIVNDELPLKIMPQDFVIFSCETIPTPTIQANRKILEQKLHRKDARLFKDIHVSGHASREDLRDLIKILSPEHIIPAHGDLSKTAAMASLGGEMNYELGKTVHILQNGQVLEL